MGLPAATWIVFFIYVGFVTLCILTTLPYYLRPEVLKKDLAYDDDN